MVELLRLTRLAVLTRRRDDPPTPVRWLLTYAAGVVTVFGHLKESELGTMPHRGGKSLAIVGAVLVGLVLGYLGWVLPVPGGSVIVPTLVVAGIGALTACLGAIFALHPTHRSLWVFCGMVVGFTIAASVWTYQFAIPASVAWDGNAVPQARLALARVGGSLQPHCSTIRDGSIGSIQPPYIECATSNPRAHFVIYRAGPDSKGGLGYTDRGAATFPDECSRHLIGPWWMFTRDTDGMGSCPVGYRFQGGG
jgi:hypothetical protein